MSNDEKNDEEARKAKAASLRSYIDRLKSPGAAATSDDDSETQSQPANTPNEEPRAPSSKSESPRDFIHRRMHELDKEPEKE
jgi:hypothetical protein